MDFSIVVSTYRFKPLEGLLSITKEETSNLDFLSAINYAEEKINSSPKGRVTELALLFYFIKILKDAGIEFYVKGGIIQQYYLGEHSRPTHDIDILISYNGDELRNQLEKILSEQKGPITFKILNYFKLSANEKYYYNTFTFSIEVLINGVHHSKFGLDGVTSPLYNEVIPCLFNGPEIIEEGFKFKGAPIEYVMAEKIIAITNELSRPYKHLIDIYGLIHVDIDINLLKKYLELVIYYDNQVRAKYNIKIDNYVYQIKEDKEFINGFIFPALQAGYTADVDDMVKEVNEWLKINL